MARQVFNGMHGYEDESDSWFTFNDPAEAQAWLAEFDPTPDYSVKNETRTVSVAPAFNAFSLGVTCPAATTYGPIVQLLQADEGRLRALVNAILPTGSYLIVGTREAVNAGQGYPLQQGLTLELANTRAVWAVLALGSATGPLVGTVGVLTESLAG
jgi:hypothetical protein